MNSSHPQLHQRDLKLTFRSSHRSFGGGAVVVVVVSIACAGPVCVVVVVVVGSRHLTLVDHKDQEVPEYKFQVEFYFSDKSYLRKIPELPWVRRKCGRELENSQPDDAEVVRTKSKAETGVV